eukprot:46313-Chlamydomonas_euryale.AAC.4
MRAQIFVQFFASHSIASVPRESAEAFDNGVLSGRHDAPLACARAAEAMRAALMEAQAYLSVRLKWVVAWTDGCLHCSPTCRWV